MTTEAAAQRYLAQHLAGQNPDWVVFNPNDKPVAELPVIYGFNDGGPREFLSAVAIAQSGHVLGGHCCSHEGYMPHDLGVTVGSRADRHAESYQKHYPDGYRMEWIPSDERDGHAGLKAAIESHNALPKPAEQPENGGAGK